MAIFTRKGKPAPSPAPAPSSASGEPRIAQIGEDMLARARGHKAGLLSAKFYSDKLMNWSMKDRHFKVQLFRFVDAFPTLRTPEMVYDHLVDYLTQPGVKLPPGMEMGLRVGGVAQGLATSTISSQIRGMAGKFIAGTDAASALPQLKALWKDGIAFSVDLLGEACVSDAEADAYQAKYLDLIRNLPEQVASWPASERLERDHLGPIPRTNVSIKVSSLSARCDPIDTEGALADLIKRLGPILTAAGERGVLVNFDMEQFALKDFTLTLFERCCEQFDFTAGLAMQAYLRSGPEDAQRIAEWAKRSGRLVTVRLVKGAYWDYETINAEQRGWPCPVWGEKWQTDACFERMAEILLDATPKGDLGGSPLRGEIGAPFTSESYRADVTSPERSDGAARSPLTSFGARAGAPGALSNSRRGAAAHPGGIRLALGSHNVRSIAAALAACEKRGLPWSAVELQMLHGMADQLKHAAAEMGLRVREYVPVGEMIPGMAYLVRRLLENTSNESWLRAGFLDNADTASLLAPPLANAPDGTLNGQARPPSTATRLVDLYLVAGPRHQLSEAVEGVGNGQPFFNEPCRDFSDAGQREAFAAALAKAQVPRVANDRTPADAARMIGEAAAAFPTWRDLDPRARAAALTGAAQAMRSRRDELSAVMVKESGKTWREADADTCEAIDFCEYYARLAVPLFEPRRLGRFYGELDEVWHQPRGVAAVISPWNFPLAICCGMTTAALVTGNTVVVKPAEQTPGIARLMCEILWESIGAAVRSAGVKGLAPERILHFCPAPGETTGAAIVRDPRIALIAFTGSKAVGLDILRAAGDTKPEQEHVKKVICEMGGKNAIIVDTSADLDEAVLGVRQSAFGFQGQKCSACSRVIVVDEQGPQGPLIRSFTRRLVESSRALTVGDPTRPGTDMGPVIDAEAAGRIRSFIETAKKEGAQLELGEPDAKGHQSDAKGQTQHSALSTQHSLIPPHIFSGVLPTHTLARAEVFGPVVAVMHAKTFDEALALANASEYKLTGGVFSRKPAHLAKAKREFRVGNLYLNRGITGALVGRQPFGGFGMSGVGSKAGGADYLLQFVEPRALCENTMRRGFAPEL